jgi:hypothetical protein
MFEHRTEPLVSRHVFYGRLARSFGLGALIIILSLLLGMAGYHFLEHLTWLDSFLNAAMILSGMGPVAAIQSAAGKVFAGCYALASGFALLTSAALIFAPIFHRFIHKFHLETRRHD